MWEYKVALRKLANMQTLDMKKFKYKVFMIYRTRLIPMALNL